MIGVKTAALATLDAVADAGANIVNGALKIQLQMKTERKNLCLFARIGMCGGFIIHSMYYIYII